MNIAYTQNGDYLIPNIVIRKTKPLGHYGRLRKAYLEMHRPILFNELYEKHRARHDDGSSPVVALDELTDLDAATSKVEAALARL